jgi:hypothetical protein
MGRYAALILAALLVGCSSPSRKEQANGDSGSKKNLTTGADRKVKVAKGSDNVKKAGPTGPPTEQEVRAAATTYLTQRNAKLRDLTIKSVSAPLDVPEQKAKELASPSTRDVKAYYISYKAFNQDPNVNDWVDSPGHVLIVGRDPDGVKVLAYYDSTSDIEKHLGGDWVTKNPPPQK